MGGSGTPRAYHVNLLRKYGRCNERKVRLQVDIASANNGTGFTRLNSREPLLLGKSQMRAGINLKAYDIDPVYIVPISIELQTCVRSRYKETRSPPRVPRSHTAKLHALKR